HEPHTAGTAEPSCANCPPQARRWRIIKMTLEEFFRDNPRAALAFSGGTDSAFLLWAAARYGAQVRAYFVKTAFQPAFELRDAERLARELSMPLTVVEADILAVPGAAENGPERCYHCKRALFTRLTEA